MQMRVMKSAERRAARSRYGKITWRQSLEMPSVCLFLLIQKSRAKRDGGVEYANREEKTKRVGDVLTREVAPRPPVKTRI
jgi:hypothetical protein